jgi:hypothetical protein
LAQWKPILPESSETAKRAWEAVTGVLHLLPPGGSKGSHERVDPYRAYEHALLSAYVGIATNDRHELESAVERLNVSIQFAASQRRLGLFGGLCGLGWTVQHIGDLLRTGLGGSAESAAVPCADDDGGGETDLTSDVDTLLLDELERGAWQGPYDLVSGLVGFGVYFLERLPARKAVLGVQLVIYHLGKAAKRSDAGVTWHTPPEQMAQSEWRRYPAGYYDLGILQGIPGVLHFLGESFAAGVDPVASRRLLDGGMEWLIAHQRPSGALSRFGPLIASGEDSDSRLAWCHGDLAIAAIILQVARRTAREDWQRFADDLVSRCVAWPVDQGGAEEDPYLCHGAAGVGHIFNRIYQLRSDPRYVHAATNWYSRTLAMLELPAGRSAYTGPDRTTRRGHATRGPHRPLLDGVVGVALALLAALTPLEPGWDRTLLLSGRIPPTAHPG